jgi:hypothetical protein
MTFRKIIYQQIVENYNYDFGQCLKWISEFQEQFGYITMANYIKMIETKPFIREEKDNLLNLAMNKMDFGCYENFFEPCKSINELYQKMFLLMSIELSFEYISKKTKKEKKTFIIWQVVAKYFIEEFQNLTPFDYQITDQSEHTSSKKIVDFFKSKDIDINQKRNEHTNQYPLFEYITRYFYK